ncbi:hypothetical protein, partial [Micromonospora sp. NPDC023814]|uniref:hypothetical protein n=1 Tax=Micromonospora sp. NPDC023814 TaxID=3154596 RepID=UPI0033D5E9C6
MRSADIKIDPSTGNTIMTADDGSVYTISPDGRTLSVTSVVHHEGGPDTYSTTTYSAWDEKGQPTAGSGESGSFTLSY